MQAPEENTMSLKDLDLKKPLRTRNTGPMKSVAVESPKELLRSLDNSASTSPKDVTSQTTTIRQSFFQKSPFIKQKKNVVRPQSSNYSTILQARGSLMNRDRPKSSTIRNAFTSIINAPFNYTKDPESIFMNVQEPMKVGNFE